MTADDFRRVVSALQVAGSIRAGHGWKQDLADELGVTRTTIVDFEARGTRQRQTDLALAALLAGLSPAQGGR